MVYLIRCVTVTVRCMTKTPDLPQQNAIAPHITGSGVLPVVQSLPTMYFNIDNVFDTV